MYYCMCICIYVYPFAQVSCMVVCLCVFVFVNVASNLNQIANVTNEIQAVNQCKSESGRDVGANVWQRE